MGNASLIHEIFQTSFELVIVTKHYINIEQGISQDSQLSILLENKIVKKVYSYKNFITSS